MSAGTSSPASSKQDIQGLVCSGCGGRNLGGRPACGWCGRPFVPQRWNRRALTLATTIAICAAVASVIWLYLQGGLLPR
jgi:hypothetical protein